jgi:hypothetical protein
MLNADSRALKKPSEPQASPTMPRSVSSLARSWMLVTAETRSSTELSGNAWRSCAMRKLDSACSPISPRSEMAMNRSGMKERSAK